MQYGIDFDAYLHNLRILDKADYDPRSGRPFLTEPLLPVYKEKTTETAQKIILEMAENRRALSEEKPFLFHITDVPKEETPQTKKIRAIFIWAGANRLNELEDLFNLFKRPRTVPTEFKELTGFHLTEQLALANEVCWCTFKLNCLAKDFFLTLKVNPLNENIQICKAYYVAASIPLGVESYLKFSSFLPEVDKTEIKRFLIYKNGAHLKSQMNDTPLKSPNERKSLAELFFFADEWEKNPGNPKNLTLQDLNGKDIWLDHDAREVGKLVALRSQQLNLPYEEFLPLSRLNQCTRQSSLGKLDRKGLEKGPKLLIESWPLFVEKKKALKKLAEQGAQIFNPFNLSLMRKAEEVGYVIFDKHHNESKLLLYFLSFLKEEHRSCENFSRLTTFEYDNCSQLFTPSAFEDKCLIMGLWIRDALESNPPMDKELLHKLVSRGIIFVKVLQEFGAKGLESFPIKNCKIKLHVIKSLEIDDQEIDKRLAIYCAVSVISEYQEILQK